MSLNLDDDVYTQEQQMGTCEMGATASTYLYVSIHV